MRQVGVCGHFAVGKDYSDGQTIKTKILTEVLEDYFGEENVVPVDTYNWKKYPIKLIGNCVSIFLKCENLVMLPGQNGLKVFVPLFVSFKKIFRRKIFYVVIGGWLPEFVKNNNNLLKDLEQFDSIFVETLSMKIKLRELGLKNVLVMPNFKKLKVLSANELSEYNTYPYKLCTFSRVIKEKGIEDAINAVIKANKEFSTEIFSLDIYGQIEERYKEEFQKILTSTPSYIKYKGIIPYNETVEILKEYYLLLFPTYYEGEGFAGTTLDAFASGLPIIASDWRYNSEIIEEGYTGRIVPIKDVNSILKLLNHYAKNPQEVFQMRKNCIEQAQKYTPEVALKVMIDEMLK